MLPITLCGVNGVVWSSREPTLRRNISSCVQTLPACARARAPDAAIAQTKATASKAFTRMGPPLAPSYIRHGRLTPAARPRARCLYHVQPAGAIERNRSGDGE